MGVTFSAGFTLGPMLGAMLLPATALAWLPPHMFQAVAFTSALLSALTWLVIVVVLPETRPPLAATKDHEAAPLSAAPEVSIHRRRLLGWTQALNASYVMVFAGLESTLAFLLAERLRYTSRETGRLLTLVGITAAVVQGGFLRRAANRHQPDELAIVILGTLALVAAYATFAAASTATAVHAGALLYALASATVVSCLTATASLLAPVSQTARVLGYMRAGAQLGRTVGPAIFGALYWTHGSRAAYAVAAGLALGPLLIAVSVRRSWLTIRSGLLHAKAS